jgi:hypothetical protein
MYNLHNPMNISLKIYIYMFYLKKWGEKLGWRKTRIASIAQAAPPSSDLPSLDAGSGSSAQFCPSLPGVSSAGAVIAVFRVIIVRCVVCCRVVEGR